jgi:hypothetical protein
MHVGIRTIATAASLALPMAACASLATLDGSSPASFERSHSALVASLSAEDQLRLQLAELILLSPKACLGTKPWPSQPLRSGLAGGQVDLLPCRAELHGLSFRAIMRRAYPAGEPAGGGATSPPNNSSKPTPLRGAA